MIIFGNFNHRQWRECDFRHQNFVVKIIPKASFEPEPATTSLRSRMPSAGTRHTSPLTDLFPTRTFIPRGKNIQDLMCQVWQKIESIAAFFLKISTEIVPIFTPLPAKVIWQGPGPSHQATWQSGFYAGRPETGVVPPPPGGFKRFVAFPRAQGPGLNRVLFLVAVNFRSHVLLVNPLDALSSSTLSSVTLSGHKSHKGRPSSTMGAIGNILWL